MAIFIKLLATRMVANSFLGLESSLAIILPTGVLEKSSSFTSVVESEKKATSAPEIRAEHMRSNKRMLTFSTITPFDTSSIDKKLEGSGSKYK